jgi:hypothetical protein
MQWVPWPGSGRKSLSTHRHGDHNRIDEKRGRLLAASISYGGDELLTLALMAKHGSLPVEYTPE